MMILITLVFWIGLRPLRDASVKYQYGNHCGCTLYSECDTRDIVTVRCSGRACSGWNSNGVVWNDIVGTFVSLTIPKSLHKCDYRLYLERDYIKRCYHLLRPSPTVEKEREIR